MKKLIFTGGLLIICAGISSAFAGNPISVRIDPSILVPATDKQFDEVNNYRRPIGAGGRFGLPVFYHPTATCYAEDRNKNQFLITAYNSIEAQEEATSACEKHAAQTIEQPTENECLAIGCQPRQ